MLNIYSLLIPVKNENSFWLVNTKLYFKNTLLNTDSFLSYISRTNSYFFPFNQCRCLNHFEDAECVKRMCYTVSVPFASLVGYVLISTRVIDLQEYTFYVILSAPISIENLNRINIEYSSYSLDNKDLPIFGAEVGIAIKMLMKSSISGDSLPLPILPLNSLQHITLNQLLNTIKVSRVTKALFKDVDPLFKQMVYTEFMLYSYPSFQIGKSQFVEFMTKQNILQKDIDKYFRCFDTACEGFIDFERFLIGVTCMDFNTVHGDQTGELRCRYIFSFYDEDNDGFLISSDIRNMIIDIYTKKEKSIDEGEINKEHEHALIIFGINDMSPKLNLSNFLTIVGILLFRGTSSLFRFDPDVSFSNRYQNNKYVTLEPSSCNSQKKLNKNYMDDIEPWTYTLAVHSAKVHEEAGITGVRPIWEDIMNREQLGEFGDKFNQSIKRLHSIDSFNRESCPNEILQSLKYFRMPDPKNFKEPYSWGEISMEILAKYLSLLCDDVANIVEKEPRMLEIKSPTYVLGDIHGNFASMTNFENILWNLGIGLSPGNFLFLGDYVDRGKYGIEVVAYLFAQKVIFPNQFYLLRGNHEIRNIQTQYSFKRECIEKFGEATGNCLWNTINIVFDMLPIAAVIDDRLFCIHGGIPRPSLLTYKYSESNPLASLRESINAIKNPLSDPEQDSQLAWEIMWSDPYRKSKDKIGTNDSICPLNFIDFGFFKNERRNTAYCFNQVALEAFLTKYHFSHVIRAHEVQQIGFNVELQAKLVTVFSSSDYCNSNEAACVLVCNKKLRLIRIDDS